MITPLLKLAARGWPAIEERAARTNAVGWSLYPSQMPYHTTFHGKSVIVDPEVSRFTSLGRVAGCVCRAMGIPARRLELPTVYLTVGIATPLVRRMIDEASDDAAFSEYITTIGKNIDGGIGRGLLRPAIQTVYPDESEVMRRTARLLNVMALCRATPEERIEIRKLLRGDK